MRTVLPWREEKKPAGRAQGESRTEPENRAAETFPEKKILYWKEMAAATAAATLPTGEALADIFASLYYDPDTQEVEWDDEVLADLVPEPAVERGFESVIVRFSFLFFFHPPPPFSLFFLPLLCGRHL